MFIRQIPGSEIVDRMTRILAGVFPNQNIRFTVASSLDGAPISVETSPEQFPSSEQMKSLLQAFRENDFLRCTHFQVHHLANQQVEVLQFVAPADKPSGQFSLRPPNGGYTRAHQVALMRSLRSEFAISDIATVIAATSGDDPYRQALHEREVMVSDLAAHLKKLQDQLKEMAVSERENRRQQETELQAQHRKLMEELVAETAKRNADVEERRRVGQADLDAKIDAFKKQEEAFETRRSTFVRRDLLDKLVQAFTEAQTPQASKGTNSKRNGVHALLIVLLLVSGGALASSLRVLLTEPFDWHMLLPLGPSLTVLVSTLVYYVRWMDRWFREHATQEFNAAKYKADMLRASWIAELSAEIREKGGTELQPALLEALSRDLFRAPGEPALEHPLESLTGLVSRLTEIQANKEGGVVIKADPKKQ